jgi:dimethylamine/trimethylamine dehydrogenase
MGLERVASGGFVLSNIYGGAATEMAFDHIVPVTMRDPNDRLYQDLVVSEEASSTLKSIRRIGDCVAPSTVAAAVYAGHKMAQCWDADEDGWYGFKREVVGLV